MTTSPQRKLAYIVIGIATILLILIISWFLSGLDEKVYTTNPIATHNIIDSTNLPSACQGIRQTMECILSSTADSEVHNSLYLSYQQLLSERNTLNNTTLLVEACNEQIDYLKSINDTQYKEIITSCLN